MIKPLRVMPDDTPEKQDESPASEIHEEQRLEQEADLLKGRPNQARSGPRARRLASAMIGWSKDVHRPYLLAIHSFHEALIALRQVHELIGPVIGEREDRQLQADMRAALEGLSEEKRKLVSNFVGEAGPGLLAGTVFFASPDESDDSRDGSAGGPETAPIESWEKIEQVFGDDRNVAVDVLALAYRKMIGPNQERLLRGALLTSAISALETLMADVVREYYLLNPGAMADEPKFSLKRLQEFDSIAEARREAATIRAEAVSGGDLGDWSAWLEKLPKVKLETHCREYKTLFEVFQRRHILVHNGGRVSRRYQEKVAPVVGDAPELGTMLDVDESYLDLALDEVEAVGNLIASGVWSKCLRDQEPVIVHQLYLRGYDLMLESRWPAVQAICEFAEVGRADADLKTICKVNALLARRELGESIEKVLDDWDVSALNPRFRFAHECLKGNPSELKIAISALVEDGSLSWGEVLEWPLLGKFRECVEFQELAKELGEPTSLSPGNSAPAVDGDSESG